MKKFFTFLGLGALLCLLFTVQAQAQLIIEWEKTIGGIQRDDLNELIKTPDGHYLLAGTSASRVSGERTAAPMGGADFWLVKIDTAGAILWDKAIGGSGEDQLNAGLITPDGGFLLAGSSNSSTSGDKSGPVAGGMDYWLVKTDASGNVLWEKSFGGNADDYLQSIVPAAGGGYLLAGYSASAASGQKSGDSQGGTDFWLIRIDEEGTLLWDKTYGGSEDEQLWAAAPTEDGGFLLGGNSLSGATGDKSQPSRGEQDFWVVRLDAAGQLLWEKTLGGHDYEGLEAVEALANGDFLLGGYSRSNISGEKSEDRLAEEYYQADYWLVKLDRQGNLLWDKTLGGQGYDVLTDILPTPGGHYLLGGYSTSGSSVYKSDNSRGGMDYWVIMVDESGNKLWDEAVGSNSSDLLTEVAATADGGYLLAGISPAYASGDKAEDNRGSYDYWIVKMEEGYGTPPVIAEPKIMLEWDKAYAPASGSLGQGSLTSVAAAADGGYLLGSSSAYRSGSRTDYGVTKLDASGNKMWEKHYGGTHIDELVSVLALPDGGFLLAGESLSNTSLDKSEDKRGDGYSPDYWVVRIDSEGNKLWDRTFGSAGDEYLADAILTADGGFLIGGNSYSYGASYDKSERGSGFWVVRLDASGNKLWDRTFSEGSLTFRTATEAADGNGFLLGGGIYGGPDSRGSLDYYVVRIDRNGDKLWSRNFGGHTAESVRALAPVADGGFIIGGWSPSRASGDKTEEKRGYSDFWVIRVDAYGNLLWDKVYGGDSSDDLMDMVATEDGGFVMAGESYSDASYEKSEERRGNNDYWAIKINEEGEKLWDKTVGGGSYDYFVGLVETLDGGFLLAGNSRSGISRDKTEDPESDTDYWIAKIQEPSRGLLAGGGWLDFPEGAYLADPFVKGKAYFGLSVRNQQGRPVRGKAHFTFLEAGLRFQSTEVDWMVIAGEKAMLTGSGVLNREEGYRFYISVEDQGRISRTAKDTYRVVVWDPTGNLVYDNQRDQALDVEARQELSAGNISIHAIENRRPVKVKGPQLKYRPEVQTVLEGFNAYPSPLDQDGLWLDIPESMQGQELELSIFDMQGKRMAVRSIRVGRAAGKQLWKFDHRDWPKGVYLLRLSGNQLLHQQKLLK